MCIAKTDFISQTDLSTTIAKPLRIQDDTSPDSNAFRNIVIIGRSIRTDLKILQRLRVNVYEVAPVLALLDTDLIGRNLFRDTSLVLWPVSSSVVS